MKFDVDDKYRCRLVCVKFHLNRCRFAAAVAKMFRGLTFWGHSVYVLAVVVMLGGVASKLEFDRSSTDRVFASQFEHHTAAEVLWRFG